MSIIANTTQVPNLERMEQNIKEDFLIAAAVIFFVAFFGLIFNILGITVVMKNPVLKNSFGTLCLSHSVANSGVLFVFFSWAAPLTYIRAESSYNLLGKVLGQMNILCWDACVYSHLAISINRLISIAFPARASFIFSRHNTFFIIVTVWFIAFCHIIPYFWYDQCFITYDPISWTWNFASTSCGFIISTYTDYYTSVGIFIAMSSVDLCTLVSFQFVDTFTLHSAQYEAKNPSNSGKGVFRTEIVSAFQFHVGKTIGMSAVTHKNVYQDQKLVRKSVNRRNNRKNQEMLEAVKRLDGNKNCSQQTTTTNVPGTTDSGDERSTFTSSGNDCRSTGDPTDKEYFSLLEDNELSKQLGFEETNGVNYIAGVFLQNNISRALGKDIFAISKILNLFPSIKDGRNCCAHLLWTQVKAHREMRRNRGLHVDDYTIEDVIRSTQRATSEPPYQLHNGSMIDDYNEQMSPQRNMVEPH